MKIRSSSVSIRRFDKHIHTCTVYIINFILVSVVSLIFLPKEGRPPSTAAAEQKVRDRPSGALAGEMFNISGWTILTRLLFQLQARTSPRSRLLVVGLTATWSRDQGRHWKKPNISNNRVCEVQRLGHKADFSI